jgi:Ca2+-binding RTX toxin-like protein
VTVTLVDDDQGTDTATAQSVVEGMGVVDGVLYIVGTSANDHVSIHQSGTGSNRLIRVNASFVDGCTDDDSVVTAPGRFALASINQIVAYLGAGDDHFNVAGNVNLPVFVDGGAGNDHLHGGAGSNLLLGGVGDDHLHGGSERDLLIGGLGADHLHGKPDDDLLIAGTTAFDDDFDVLTAIMAEWNSSRSYATRVANLTDGTGSSTRVNGDSFLRADGPDAIVFDDNAQDHLHGASGLDWFFASLEEDHIDEKNNELVEDLL